MNKKIFGIKVGTILMAFLCIVIAALLWLMIEYTRQADSSTAKTIQDAMFRGYL